MGKFPHASTITPLVREKVLSKVLSKVEHLLEWTVMPMFGLFNIVDQLNNFGGNSLVESGDKQYLVSVTNEFITTTEIVRKITDKKFVIGSNKYKKMNYPLI